MKLYDLCFATFATDGSRVMHKALVMARRRGDAYALRWDFTYALGDARNVTFTTHAEYIRKAVLALIRDTLDPIHVRFDPAVLLFEIKL